MGVIVNYKNLEQTESLGQKIEEKSSKLNKFFNSEPKIEWTCHVEHNDQISELNVSGDGQQFHASSSADSLYKTFDENVRKVVRQIKKKKTEAHASMVSGGSAEI